MECIMLLQRTRGLSLERSVDAFVNVHLVRANDSVLARVFRSVVRCPDRGKIQSGYHKFCGRRSRPKLVVRIYAC
jgi:hypothetical protein